MTRKTGRALARAGGAWLVLSRNVSDSVSIEGESDVRACMVLDVDTGLVRGLATAAAEIDAVAQAIKMGLTTPAGSLAPGPPDAVLCAPQLEVEVNSILASLFGRMTPPSVRTTEPFADAEDIFDSFVGHMSGRSQPTEQPSTSDWALMYLRALEFYTAAPWVRWNDGIVMTLETSLDAVRSAVVVMGNSGIQHGLVLYPGGVPEGLADWEPGSSLPMPEGTRALLLDPPSDLPTDLRNKALRYGWPDDAELMPVVLRLEGEEGGDPGASDARLMAVALAAVTAHDARGPVGVGTAHQVTKGEVVLGDGCVARFSISQAPPPPPGGSGTLRLEVHEAGTNLVPRGTGVVLGHLPWESLPALRTAARLHRPVPPGAPAPAGREVPLFVILPRKQGELLAARVAELDPFGVVSTLLAEGEEVFVLAGANGAEQLMATAADSPGVADFHRRMRATKGLHLVMVADEETKRGEGTVYGLFECHHPLVSAPKQQSRRPKSSTRRR